MSMRICCAALIYVTLFGASQGEESAPRIWRLDVLTQQKAALLQRKVSSEPRFIVITSDKLYDVLYVRIRQNAFTAIFENDILARDQTDTSETFLLKSPDLDKPHPFQMSAVPQIPNEQLATVILRDEESTTITRLYLRTAADQDSLILLGKMLEDDVIKQNAILLAAISKWYSSHELEIEKSGDRSTQKQSSSK